MSEAPFSSPENDALDYTLAEQALSFGFAFQYAPEYPEDPKAIVNELELTVAHLQQTENLGSISWSQGFWKQQPSGQVIGNFETIFEDGSALSASLTQQVDATETDNIFGPPSSLYISFIAKSLSENNRMSCLTYIVPHGRDKVRGSSDRALGMKLAAAFELVDSLDIPSLDDGQVDELLGGLLLEGLIAKNGLDSSIDADIEHLRDENDDFRKISDSIHEANEGKQLAVQMGVYPERTVGPDELVQLVQFLQSL